MSNAPGRQGPLTFQDIAKRLPPDKLKRLAEIRKAYPHIPLDRLPDVLKREAQEILQIGINALPGGHAKSAALPGPNVSTLFSVLGTDLKDNQDVVIYQKDLVLFIAGRIGKQFNAKRHDTKLQQTGAAEAFYLLKVTKRRFSDQFS